MRGTNLRKPIIVLSVMIPVTVGSASDLAVIVVISVVPGDIGQGGLISISKCAASPDANVNRSMFKFAHSRLLLSEN